MIVQNQFPFGGEPNIKKTKKSTGLILFGVLSLLTVAGLYYNYTLTNKINKNA